MNKKMPPVKNAFYLSFPVMFAYGPLGIVFGILAAHLNEPWYFAPLFSLFIYAGAVQFVALGIMEVHGTFFTLFFSTIFLALRNAFYGLSLLKRFDVKPLRKLYLIFGLVDATFAILIANPHYKNKKDDVKFITALTLLTHSYWVIGTLIGTSLSSVLTHFDNLEFVLVAFFALLVFEQFLKNKNFYPILIGSIAMSISLLTIPSHMLLAAILFCVVSYLAAFYWKEYYG